MPSSPLLTSLPEYFSRWEALVKNFPALIRERHIREEVHALPPLEFSGQTLTSEREWQRAYVLLTFLAQAYIWMEGERGLPDRVPKILAVPWKKTADHLGLAPCITYASAVLYKLLEATRHQWIDGWKQHSRLFTLCQRLLGQRMNHGSTLYMFCWNWQLCQD